LILCFRVNTREGRLKLIAHRGGRGFGTDNTLEAMEEAARNGIRMIETDVRMTADGELIICHDATVWGHVVRRTNLDELRKHAPERPLLSEVLERLAGWVTFNIEVKDASMRALEEMLDTYSLKSDTLISSFHTRFLDGLKALFPKIRTGYIYRMPYGQEKKLESAMDIGAEVILPHFNSISEQLVKDAHDYGLEVYAWTVNEDKDLKKLQEWGIDGVITDRYLEIKRLQREDFAEK
jgi:glycerophosphoryl diester phosphodiesterase